MPILRRARRRDRVRVEPKASLIWLPAVRCARRGLGAIAFALLLAGPAVAQTPAQESRPYDEKLLRLSEVLGAVHFLRELCGNTDGML